MDINAISALSASKPSRRALIPITTIDMSVQNSSNRCYRRTAKAQGKRGISRISGLAYNTVVSIVRSSSARALLVHNNQVEQVTTEEVSGDAPVVICAKKQKQCFPEELDVGDCWIGISLADSSGLILAARVGKHTDELPIGTGGEHRRKNELQAMGQ